MTRKIALLPLLLLLSLFLAASAPIGTIPFPLSDVSNDPSHLDEVRSAVAFGRGMDTYFTVWQRNSADGLSTSLYGRFVSRSGALTGITYPIPITPGVNIDPDVVYNPTNDQYLIVYSHDSTSIRGLIVGNVGSPVGSEFIIASGLTVNEHYYRPAVAYSITSHQYLITWTHNPNGFQGIEARTITNDGITFGAVWDVTGIIASDPDYSDVAWSSTNDQFLVVWNRTVSANLNVYGRLIQMSVPAGPVGSELTLFNTTDGESYPAVASLVRSNGAGQYMIVCQKHSTSTTIYSVEGMLLSADGFLDMPPTAVSGGGGYVPAVAGNSASHEYLVVWPHNASTFQARTVSPLFTEGPMKTFPLAANWDVAAAPGPLGDFLLTASGTIQAGYHYDVAGLVWGTRAFLPVLQR